MSDAEPMVVRDLVGLTLPERTLAAYDRPIGLRLLHEDPDSGVELYVVEYPEGRRPPGIGTASRTRSWSSRVGST